MMEEHFYVRIGARLKTARLNKGITQLEIAEALGVPQNTISRWETGAYRLHLHEFIAITDYLGVDASVIVKTLAGASTR